MIRLLAEAIESDGISRDQFLEATGVDPTKFDDHEARLSNDEYNRIQIAALRLSRNQALVLRLGEYSRAAAFDLLGHLTEHASTLRQGIEAVVRYKAILSGFPKLTLSEQRDKALIRYELPRFDPPGARLISELAMSGLMSLIRKFVGPRALPHRVFFEYEAPEYRREYERVFGGTERFEHAFTGIEFERSWLDCTQLITNPKLYSILQAQAERTLGRLRRNCTLSEIVLEYLVSDDRRKMPSMNDVARHLGMSARSLRRRLEGEGTGYKSLITQARISLAKRMLENTNTTIKETAYTMGFATPTAFCRSFKRWTGMTPKQYQSSY